MRLKKTIRIVCAQEHESQISKTINNYGFYIRRRYYRGLVILVVDVPKYGASIKIKKLLDLQDNFLKLK